MPTSLTELNNLPSLEKTYNEQLYKEDAVTGELPYVKYTEIRQALINAGGYIFADTPPGYRSGEIKEYKDEEVAINMQGLLDFVARAKGPIYEARGFEDECSVFFTTSTPVVDFESTSAVKPLDEPTRPTYLWAGGDPTEDLEEEYYGDQEKWDKLAGFDEDDDNDETEVYELMMEKRFGKGSTVVCIYTHDNFDVNWEKLQRIANSNNPVATCKTSMGSSNGFVVIQTPKLQPEFKLVRPGIALPFLAAGAASGGVIKIPSAGKHVSKSIEERWNTRMNPLLKEGKGVIEYMEKYGKGISPEKLKELAQMAVNTGNLKVAEELLKEAQKIEVMDR